MLKLCWPIKGDLLNWYVLVYKVGLVLNRFAVTSGELQWLMEPDKGPALGWLDLTKLPLELTTDREKDAPTRYEGWRRLVDLYTFRDAHSAGDTTVIAVLEVAHAETDADPLIAALVTLTGWNAEDLETLLAWDAAAPSSLGLSHDDCLDERFLVRLEEAFTLLTRLGMAATSVNAWKVPVDQTMAESIKNALKAKYTEESWPAVAESLEDPLREKRRDALVAYVMAENAFEDTNELYSYYLIDFEMTSCMKTSRMVQAHCSVQLFVQRCLLNLEAVSMTEDNQEQWEWRQQYRVWEAARKIFLNPRVTSNLSCARKVAFSKITTRVSERVQSNGNGLESLEVERSHLNCGYLEGARTDGRSAGANRPPL